MEPFCIHNKQAAWKLSRYYNRRRVIFTLTNNATVYTVVNKIKPVYIWLNNFVKSWAILTTFALLYP